MYIWQDHYQQECATGLFTQGQDYIIYRRGCSVLLAYYGSISSKKGDKTADVFVGIHDGGTNEGEALYFALMDNRYSCSDTVEKALQKLWSGKTNKLHSMFRVVYGRRPRG